MEKYKIKKKSRLLSSYMMAVYFIALNRNTGLSPVYNLLRKVIGSDFPIALSNNYDCLKDIASFYFGRL